MGSMTFGRKPFHRNDVWLNATFGRYDVSPTTTFRRLRQLVGNLVEIWSKTDSYGKNKNYLHLRFSHLQYIFTPVSVLVSLSFVYWKYLYATFRARLLLVKSDSTSTSYNLSTHWLVRQQKERMNIQSSHKCEFYLPLKRIYDNSPTDNWPTRQLSDGTFSPTTNSSTRPLADTTSHRHFFKKLTDTRRHSLTVTDRDFPRKRVKYMYMCLGVF